MIHEADEEVLMLIGEEIVEERMRAWEKGFTLQHDYAHSISTRSHPIGYAMGYLDGAHLKISNNYNEEEVRANLLKAAGCIVAAIDLIDRGGRE